MNRPDEKLERLTDLLADRATDALTPEQERELDQLVRTLPDAAAIVAAYDAVEGGLTLAAHESAEPLPLDLRASLLAAGRAMVSGGSSSAPSTTTAMTTTTATATTTTDRTSPLAPASVPGVASSAATTPSSEGRADGREPRATIASESDAPEPISLAQRRAAMGASSATRSSSRFMSNLGWLVAAAAIVLAAIAWWPGAAEQPEAPSLAERRATLERDASDAITVALSTTDDPAATGVAGDIVWSNARQQGYLRIRGLAVNDPNIQQYQMWIYDDTRDDAYPVDAGVFDIAHADIDPITRDVIIPIDARLAIGRPRTFAITIERPGGVVVTDRARVVATARVG